MSNRLSNGQPYGPGITRISVTGFKSLANRTDVEIRPMTILAGANSSGKSSVMQPLLLMKQTLESAFAPAGPFLLAGPYTRYTETKQFLSRSSQDVGASGLLDLEFEIGWHSRAGFTFGTGQNGQFDVLETRGENFTGQPPVRITRNTPANELRAASFPWLGALRDTDATRLQAERMRYSLGIRFNRDAASGAPADSAELMEVFMLNKEIRELIHVPGLRGDQHRKWLLATVQPSNPFAPNTFDGPFESYVPSLIESWQPPKESEKMFDLVQCLRLLGLASGVSAERLNESEVEVRVPRTSWSDADDYINVADVGLAVSTVLPVMVALIQAQPDQLVYIEQPELHLHPKAQFLISQLLVKASNRGVRVVIETHSSLLLRGILTEVAKGAISKDKVMLHWFERDKATGISTVKSQEPDAAGRVGDWPEDFSDVELSSDNDYLNAVEGNLFAAKK